MAQLKTRLTDLFASLKSTTAGIRLLNLQDFVAGSSCQPLGNRMTPSDAVSWVRFLAGLRQLPEVAINVEQFAMDCVTGSVVPGDRQAVADREAFYSAQGLPFGPAFEIRYWMRTHG